MSTRPKGSNTEGLAQFLDDWEAEQERERVRRDKLAGGVGEYVANYRRILPQHPNMRWWVHIQPVHFGVGPNKRAIGCPKKAKQGPCPICDFAWEQYNEGREGAKSLLPAVRFSVNTVRLNADGSIADPSVYVWDMGGGLFGRLHEKLTDIGRDIDPTDLETGRTIRVRRKGTDLTTKYRVNLLEPSPFPGDPAPFLENLYDLTALTPFLEPKDALALLEGRDTSSVFLPSGDPWAASPKALPAGAQLDDGIQTSTQPSKAGQAAEDPGDDEDEDDVIESESPAVTVSSAPAKESDDDDDEDEEDERPRRPRRKAQPAAAAADSNEAIARLRRHLNNGST